MIYSSLIRRIILDLTFNRKKEYSPTGKHVGPKGGRFDYLDERYIRETDPNYHPEKTSINKNKLPSGMTEALKRNLIPPNSKVLDYGGGKYDNGKERIESEVSGSQMHIYDPYSRDETHNKQVMSIFKGNDADVVMNHNVLNVIQDKEERATVVKNAYSFVKPGGQLHISVYIGDSTGTGKKVMHGKSGDWNWQENRKTKDYIQEIQLVIPDATLESSKNGLLVFRKPVTKNNP